MLFESGRVGLSRDAIPHFSPERLFFSTRLFFDRMRNRRGRPAPKRRSKRGMRASFFTSLDASLTVEASVVLPVFLLCMLAVLHLGNVERTAIRFGSALTEVSEEMAVGAYVSEYGEGSELLRVVLSAVWARGRTMGMVGNAPAVKNANFLLSSFRSQEEMIDLVLTYQMKSPVGLVRIPGGFWVQRGAVRSWTGRKGSGGKQEEDTGGAGQEKVFVAVNGQVYHRDENCSHIRLTIRSVSREAVSTKRNLYGEKYHACEICGGNAGSEVYITTDGNRYHSSAACRGLKRTVREVSLEEASGLRPCSRCGGHHE